MALSTANGAQHQARQAGVQLVLAGLLVVALAEVSRQLAFSNQSVSLVWPIAGLGLVMLYRWGWAGWAALASGLAVWAAWRYGSVPMAVPAVVVAGSVGPTAVWLATRRVMGRTPQPFQRLSTVTRWLKAELLLGAPLAATLGIAALGWLDPAAMDRQVSLLAAQWAGYWIIEACGALLVAPVAWHFLMGEPRTHLTQRMQGLLKDLLDHPRLLWLSPLMAAVLAAAFAFGDTSNARAFSYLLLPVLLIVANQCRPAATHAHVMFAALLVTAASAYAMRHLRPGADASILIELILLVLFLLVSASVLLVLVAIYAERREALEKIESQAFVDPLTGLLTDLGLARAYEQAGGDRPQALALLRLGNWRAIEYLDGPAALNRLEMAAARALASQDPPAAWARSSPGRFFALVDADVCDVETLMRWQSAAASATVETPGQPVGGSARPLWRACAVIGQVTGTERPSLQTLMARLREIDLSQADAAGPVIDRVAPDDGHRIRERAALVERVRQAIAERRVRLMVQPIVPVRALDGDAPRACGEVLLRLLDESGAEMSPAQFMPAAVQGGFMPWLDRAVVEATLELFSRHPHALAHIDYCSINLSGPTLARADLARRLEEAFQQRGVPPKRFVFEVTESQAIAQPREAARSLSELRERGFRVAIDDFGTGHATFDYLKRFPADILKIDGSFVRELEHQPLDRVIVRSMVDVARLLGVRTVAEFVESAALLEQIRELGIDSAQGYHVGLPRPLEDWLAELSAPARPRVDQPADI